ncbi:MAG: thiolase family protein [Candidatus Hodarchaeales archaeon]|jgi:acetyl-CoA acetyltransferase family protein
MQFSSAFIPYGCYWSSPFVRWQGSFANQNSIELASEVTTQALINRKIQPESFNSIYLGITIPQKHSFYGQTWLSGLLGAPNITGPMIAQACATSARVIANASSEIEARNKPNHSILTITCDRTSNGPHIIYPVPNAPGGKPDTENWVWDSFGYDPYAKNSMIQTAENVSKNAGITREAQEDATLLRYKQYDQALKNDAEFLRKFMVLPIEVKSGRKVIATVEKDEGIHSTSVEGLAKLKPVMKDGSVTFGTQTHPADGNCGLVLTTQEKANEISLNPDYEIQILSFGQARSTKGYMPIAPVPASQNALDAANITVSDLNATKLHNPFSVNDVYFSEEMGISLTSINNYGSSLVWGHPQAPTGMRLLIELIEELVIKKGGYGLMAGCSAGDSAAAIVIKVNSV